MTTLYGIKNCDTVKKARQWLDQHGIDYSFHDVRTDGLEPQQVNAWITQLGWQAVVNKRSTSWKQLDEASRATMSDESASAAILANPTLFKRPLLDRDGSYSTGFKAADFAALFAL